MFTTIFLIYISGMAIYTSYGVCDCYYINPPKRVISKKECAISQALVSTVWPVALIYKGLKK